MSLLKYIFIGIYFGIVLIKSEAVSWFRIQEMFLFDSFHMYGILGSAILTAFISYQLIQRYGKDIKGRKLEVKVKPTQYKAHLAGGIVFGLGWAMTGACPGPLYALLGGLPIMIVPLVSAILGVMIYGLVRDRLPH